MTRPLVPSLVLAAAFCAACRSNPPGEGAAPTASVSANPVDACLQVMAVEAASSDSGRAGKMARGCAALYKEASCRDAHLHYDEGDPEKRALNLTRACAQAYCSKLPVPAPQLCDPTLEKPGDLADMWWDLRVAIWKLDLGPAEASRLEKEMLHLAALQQQKSR